mmetsp:Transcript_158795/g.304688  ORF Transcript_158795/g.304688 Transcript_158795/m.304688 type:complete len:83 (-) Transcript_158795:47-295(-)
MDCPKSTMAHEMHPPHKLIPKSVSTSDQEKHARRAQSKTVPKTTWRSQRAVNVKLVINKTATFARKSLGMAGHGLPKVNHGS